MEQSLGKFQTQRNPYDHFDGDFGDQFQLFQSDHDHHSYAKFEGPVIAVKALQLEPFVDLYKTFKVSPNQNTQLVVNDFIETQKQLSTRKEEDIQVQQSIQSSSNALSSNFIEYDSNSPSFSIEEISDKSSTSPKSLWKTVKAKGELKISSKLSISKKISSESQTNSTQKTKTITKRKKDQRKNMYGLSVKLIIREFLSKKYISFLLKVCQKFGVTEDQVKKFYQEKLAWSISLKDLAVLLNYNEQPAGSIMGGIKRAFHAFYVWFMRKRYTIHILTEAKIIHKQPYLQAKNYLIYLPELKQKVKKNTRLSER